MKVQRWIACLYDPVTAGVERSVFSTLRAGLLGGLGGRVLELGAGTGASLQHYPAGSRVVATEPDPYMLEQAVSKAAGVRARVRFVQCRAEALPFRTAVFDTAVATLVLCSVADPARSLQEAHRVLRSGGELRVLEHVRAAGWRGRAQDLVAPVWQHLAMGCQLNRQTANLLEHAGFDVRHVQEKDLRVTPLLVGAAHKGVVSREIAATR